MRTLSCNQIHDHQTCSHAGHRHVPATRLRSGSSKLPAVALFLALAAFWLGWNLAENPAQAKARVEAHNQAVTAATEAAAVNYSRVGSAQDSSPEGLIPMSAIDASYRFEN